MEADAERGQRIKQLREDQHLTQQALADKIPVTLRALQAWEAGGGITWENVKALAKHVNAKPEYILNGEEGSRTPDLIGGFNGKDIAALRKDIAGLRTELSAFRQALGTEPGPDLLPMLSAVQKAVAEHLARPPKPSRKRASTGSS